MFRIASLRSRDCAVDVLVVVDTASTAATRDEEEMCGSRKLEMLVAVRET